MKNIMKNFAIFAAATLMFTSCIEQITPQDGTATTEQVGASATALKASVYGLSAQMTQGYLVYGDQVHETDMAYPALMIAQAELLGDLFPATEGYDWYRDFNCFDNVNENSYYCYLPWYTLYKFVKSANSIIGTVDPAKADKAQLSYLGTALTARAFDYYTLMTLWEAKANIYTDCDSVVGLTVPIVTEKTTEEMAKNNPRATRAEMMKFILSDLTTAEKYLKIKDSDTKLFPGLACSYGIKARAFMWNEQYDSAAVYARKAIDTWGATPVTEAQWLDTKTGFNTENQAWMWKVTYVAETMRNLANFTGWMSAESSWSYGELMQPCIDKSLYDKIGKKDFRKYTFLDPDRTFYKYESPRGEEWLAEQPNYLSLKFRCVSGDYKTYSVGACADVPIMRIEEFYILEAEAIAMTQGLEAGKAALESFVKTYRDPNYSSKALTVRELQLEALDQMRIEFWGEGQAFAQAKRLQPNSVQNYKDTNAPTNRFKKNCYGMKPNWNFVIPISEISGNQCLEKQQNPDPSGSVTGPTPVGTFATGKYKADKNADPSTNPNAKEN